MVLLCLNRQNKVLGYFKISSGGMTGTVCDVRMIFQIALKTNAVGIMLAHNHPSGNLLTSPEDDRLTRQVKEAGRVLDIQLLDHLILTSEAYFSYADEGKL